MVARTHTPSRSSTRVTAQRVSKGSTAKYRDRPTDDGMRGDGAQEPNAGSPRLPRQGPSRRAHRAGVEKKR